MNDTNDEDTMPPITVLSVEWENWLAEVQQEPTDDELNDMEPRFELRVAR